MRATYIAAVLLQVVHINAFVAVQPAWQTHSNGGALEFPSQRQERHLRLTQNPNPALEAQSAALPSSGLIAGIAILIATSLRKAKRTAIVCKAQDIMRNDVKKPANFQANQIEGVTEGKGWREWWTLRKLAKKHSSRWYSQKKILRESGVWHWDDFHHWKPRDGIRVYDQDNFEASHPNNPYFPDVWGGEYDEPPPILKAVRLGVRPPMSASIPQKSVGTFVAGRRPVAKSHLKRGTASSAVQLYAHKKAAGSTVHQGRKNNPRFRGIQPKGKDGCAVKCGTLLVRQLGFKWKPGRNVMKAKDYTLQATRDGIVQWRGEKPNMEISVIPWEYVRSNCEFYTSKMLMPKKYEPWMGNRDDGSRKRWLINQMREEWLESDEGKAHIAKKNEKKQKQREIQARIRKHTWEKREGKLSDKEAVAA